MFGFLNVKNILLIKNEYLLKIFIRSFEKK